MGRASPAEERRSEGGGCMLDRKGRGGSTEKKAKVQGGNGGGDNKGGSAMAAVNSAGAGSEMKLKTEVVLKGHASLPLSCVCNACEYFFPFFPGNK